MLCQTCFGLLWVPLKSKRHSAPMLPPLPHEHGYGRGALTARSTASGAKANGRKAATATCRSSVAAFVGRPLILGLLRFGSLAIVPVVHAMLAPVPASHAGLRGQSPHHLAKPKCEPQDR